MACGGTQAPGGDSTPEGPAGSLRLSLLGLALVFLLLTLTPAPQLNALFVPPAPLTATFPPLPLRLLGRPRPVPAPVNGFADHRPAWAPRPKEPPRSILHSDPAFGLPPDARVNPDGTVTRTTWRVYWVVLVAAVGARVALFFHDVARFPRRLRLALSGKARGQLENAEDERRRNLEACQRVAILGVAANLVLFLMQSITGLAGNSAGMIAKAVDSFGDLMGDAVSYFSIKQAHRPPDKNHQFGHGKYESLGALSIAALLLVAAWEAATESFEALHLAQENVTFEGPGVLALYGAAASVVIKEMLYRVMMSVGKATNSDSTMANANHHRMDGFASIIVFAGIIGARLGFKFADPAAGVLVAVFILKAAFSIAAEAFNDLTDGVPTWDTDTRALVQAATENCPGVVQFSNLRSRKMGPFVALQFDLVVDPALTVAEVAQVEDNVKKTILRTHENITEIGIRVLPAGAPAPAGAPPPAFAV